MSRRRAYVEGLTCAALALALGLGVPLPRPIAVLALAWALGFQPGMIAARRLASRASGSAHAMLALTLSPFLTAAPAAALEALGLPFILAARVVILAVALASLMETFAVRRNAQQARAEDSSAAWGAALSWSALIALLLLGNRWLPGRSDGAFHAAVTLQIAARGLPPEDPFFAGLRLLYFWGAHVWAAMWLALSPRLAVWTPLIALNLAGAFATPLGVCLLARRLGASDRGEWAAAGLATLGLAPFAWLAVAARVASGAVRGWPELRRIITLGADPALQYLSPGLLHPSLAFFGDKFLVLTPFALGMALFAAFILALLDAIERPNAASVTTLALVAAAALFLHTVVGLSALVLAGVWWLSALWRGARRDRSAARALVPVALAVVLALGLLTPYLLAVTAGKQRALAPGASPRALFSWAWAGALFVPAGLAWLIRRAPRLAAARELLVLTLALTVLAFAVRLPEANQSKFFNLLFLLLAAPASLALLELGERLRRRARTAVVLGVGLATLPTVALCVWGFACECGQTRESWHDPTPGARKAMAWARENTRMDAVFADASGASVEVVALAGRSLVSPGSARERDWGYPDSAMAVRRAATHHLFAGGSASPPVAAYLASLGRPVVVVARGDEVDSPLAPWNEAGDRGRYRVLHREQGISLLAWQQAHP